MINWAKVTKDEDKIAVSISKRAAKLAKDLLETDISVLDLISDIEACHVSGNPLRLQELLEANTEDFLHDVFGIRRHIDRETGKLTDCFVPRYSAKQ